MNERDADRHERWLADELSDEERSRFESEALADADRAETLYSDVALHAELSEAADARTAHRPRRAGARLHRRRLAGAGVLVAVLAVAILGPVFFPTQQRPPATLRSGETPAPELIGPSGLQERFPREFSWHAKKGAALYRWELYDEDARLRATAVLTDTLLVRPAEATPADSLGFWRWLVVPISQNGNEGTTSESLDFSLEERE